MMDLATPVNVPAVSFMTNQSMRTSLHTSKSRGVVIESQKKEAEKAAVAFLDKAHNFGEITRDDCLGRLTLANSRGDLDRYVRR